MNTETKKQASITPGQWYSKPGTSPHYQGQIASEETGQTIAITYNDETGANGTAISAVPELIGALKACIEYFEGVPEREVGPSSEAYLQARAALEKAGVL